MSNDSISGDVDLSGRYGDALADVYDQLYPITPAVEECADTLADLAGKDGSVLEFGVGTGRIAVTLAQRGVRVTGLDASARMLDALRAKDPDGTVETVQAAFGTADLSRRFDLVLGAYNALCCAPSQAEQIDTLHVMRRHLADGGRVVLETFEPARYHAQRAAETTVKPLGHDRVLLETVEVVPDGQIMFVTSAILDGAAPAVSVTFMRYVWPAELDLMARAAGLALQARWGGWDRSAFTMNSQTCVSVYEATDE